MLYISATFAHCELLIYHCVQISFSNVRVDFLLLRFERLHGYLLALVQRANRSSFHCTTNEQKRGAASEVPEGRG